MKCVAHPVLLLLATCLVAGGSCLAHAQEADDTAELRLEMGEDADAESVPPPERVSSSAITAGDDNVQVRQRKQENVDAYAQQGLPFGALRLFPSLEIGSVASSNVRQSITDKEHGFGVRIKPSARVESNWSRHSLTASASADFAKSLTGPDLKSINGDAQGNLRLDIRRYTHADVDLTFNADTIAEGSSELPLTAVSGRQDLSFGSGVSVAHDFGGLEGGLRLGLSRNVFGDVKLAGGAKEDNSDRDSTLVEISARAQLKTGGALEPFAEAAYLPRFYDKKQDRNGQKRNSQGVRLRAGFNFADEPIWTGSLAATLEYRKYAGAALDDAMAPGLEANLTWRPTDLTRFEFNAGTSLSETISVNESATSNWNVGVRAVHALRENVEVYASLQEDIEKSAGNRDYTTTAGFGVDWTVNPFVVINAGYEGIFFNGDAPNTDYAEHRLLTSIVLRR